MQCAGQRKGFPEENVADEAEDTERSEAVTQFTILVA